MVALDRFVVCTICDDSFAVDDKYVSMPPCTEHAFHPDCFMPFIQWCNNCPVCVSAS
jgi:hypothetical protein